MLQYSQTSKTIEQMKNILLIVTMFVICTLTASAKSSLMDSTRQILMNSITLNPGMKNIHDMDHIKEGRIFKFNLGNNQIIQHLNQPLETASEIVYRYLQGNHENSSAVTAESVAIKTAQTTAEDAFKEAYPVPNGISNMIPVSKDTASQYSKKEREAMQLHAEQVRESDAKLYKIYGILVAFVLLIASYKIWKERRDKSRLVATLAIEEENQKTEMVDMLEEEPYGVTQTAHQYEWATVEPVPAYNYLRLLSKVAASLMLLLIANNASASNGDIAMQLNFFAIVIFIVFVMVMILSGSKSPERKYVRIPEGPEEKPNTALKLWREDNGSLDDFFKALREYVGNTEECRTE
jgi:hypothetical protein